MKRLLFIATVSALALAKPETYREKEDFQYSRSSSDDGTKSGYYGAQRGNTGGNFERAHNMDSLAQNQMSGLVRQVEGELGDGSQSKTGSVFTAANTRGVYGSSNYDLSNLRGRNFQEGLTHGDTQASSFASHNSGFGEQSNSQSSSFSGSNSQNSRYTGRSGASQQYNGNLQINDDRDDSQRSNSQFGSHRSGYYSQSGYSSQSQYEHNNQNADYGSNAQTRLVSGAPVKIMIRPGTKVTIPVAAQSYDVSNTDSSLYNQNTLKSEAEVLNNNNNQRWYVTPIKPKQYESSYSYRKEWEKHDSQPITVAPLPLPTNSELYEDVQSSRLSGKQYQNVAVNSNTGGVYGAYRENHEKASASSQSRADSRYVSQQSSGSGAHATSYSQGSFGSDSTGSVNSIDSELSSKPKSYHSSYSYHKSWERQGDPYVIKPAGEYQAQVSQQLTDANQAAYSSSHRHGSHYRQGHQSYAQGGQLDCDCDENGHIRVPRSYNTDELQQSQVNWDQQSQSAKLEDLGQQTQNQWGNLEDLGQQAQNPWDQQSQSGKLEDLGQQSQNNWGQLEDLTQQSQNQWDQQSQSGLEKLEELGQQTQNNWDKLENLSQQTQKSQNQWEQQSQSGFDQLGDLSQQVQQAQRKWRH